MEVVPQINANVVTLAKILHSILSTSATCSILFLIFLPIRRVMGYRMKPQIRTVIEWMILFVTLFLLFFQNKRYLWRNFFQAFFPYDLLPGRVLRLFAIPHPNPEGTAYYYHVYGETLTTKPFFSQHDLGNLDSCIRIVFTVWLIGAIFLFIWNYINYLVLKAKLRDYPDSRDFITEDLLICEKAYQNIDQNIPIVLLPETVDADIVKAPCVIGFFHPIIVLPENKWADLSLAEKSAVITHELFHIKKHDNFINLFLLFFRCVYWFHPVLWHAVRKIRSDIEYLRDDQIVRQESTKENAINYARAIVTIAAEKNWNSRTNSLNSGLLYSKSLGFRIMLLAEKSRQSLIISLLVLVFFTFLCLFSFAYSPDLFPVDLIG